MRLISATFLMISTISLAPVSMADSGHHLFERADTDKNGTVSEQEFDTAHDRFFAELDSNGDKQITEEEISEMWRKRHEDGMRHGDGRGGRMFRHADANGDQEITEAEFLAAHQERFKAMDTNNDGKISVEEAEAARKMFSR